MPLHYALGALKAALSQTKAASTGRVTNTIENVLLEIVEVIRESEQEDGGEPMLDKGRQVRRTIEEIRKLFPPSGARRPSTRLPAKVHVQGRQSRARRGRAE